MSRVLICGGRDFADKRLMMATLDTAAALHGEASCVIEGGANGADRIGRQWARWKKLPVLTVDADWDGYGKAAGGIRNQWMIDHGKPDYVVAFPTSQSIGTHDMIRRAEKAGLPVVTATSS